MKIFSIKEVLRSSWEKYKEHALFLIIVLFISWAVSLSPEAANKTGEDMYGIFQLALTALSIIISIGMTKIAIEISRGHTPDYSELFKNYRLFFRYFFGSILFAVIVLAGTLLLIVPGIIWATKYSMFSYLIVDKDLGPIEALKESARLTNGVKKDLLWLFLALLGINLMGILAFGVGLLITVPLSMLTVASVYLKLAEHAGEAHHPEHEGEEHHE